jgi:hypothetical protein
MSEDHSFQRPVQSEGSAWRKVAEFDLSNVTTIQVYATGFTSGKDAEAWSAYAILHDEVAKIYVFAEVAESVLSKARASAACFDARAS